jgi:hypothetical protein
MKKFKIPKGIKEIMLYGEGDILYLCKKLVKKDNEWAIVETWELLEEIKQ